MVSAQNGFGKTWSHITRKTYAWLRYLQSTLNMQKAPYGLCQKLTIILAPFEMDPKRNWFHGSAILNFEIWMKIWNYVDSWSARNMPRHIQETPGAILFAKPMRGCVICKVLWTCKRLIMVFVQKLTKMLVLFLDRPKAKLIPWIRHFEFLNLNEDL